MKGHLVLPLLLAVTTLRATAGLLVHLPFDQDGTDLTDGGHNAQAHNGAAIDLQRFKLGGGSATFDGKASFYDIPAFTPVLSNQVRSVSFWERSETPSQLKPNRIFLGWGLYSGDAGVRYDVCLENGSDSQLRVEFNTTFVVSGGEHVNFCDGKWHLVVVTYDGRKMRFYVDGEHFGEPIPIDQPLLTSWNPVGTVIGTGVREASGVISGRQVRFFSGQLDDVGIWDTVLSDEDVKLLYGLAGVGDNDLRWLESARKLWQQPVGSTARINGCTWQRVDGLRKKTGYWMRVVEPNGAGSFIVLDRNGGGLQITPLWWENQSVQVLGLSLMILAGLALLLWLTARLRWRIQLRRMEAKERMEAERRRIAQDLHDDLGSGLTEIMSLGDLAEHECSSPAELKSRLVEIAGKTRELVEGLDQIVWTANPVNDEIPRLISYLCDYAERFLRAKGIRCRLEVPDQLPALPVSAKSRHHILLAIKEALNNAVKHSGASEVWLRIQCDTKDLKLMVEDNGKGFEPVAAQTGNGLTNMRDRVAKLGGRADIDSIPGKGTKIAFVISIRTMN